VLVLPQHAARGHCGGIHLHSGVQAASCVFRLVALLAQRPDTKAARVFQVSDIANVQARENPAHQVIYMTYIYSADKELSQPFLIRGTSVPRLPSSTQGEFQ
jgi:hypothetical protein